jgi:addiction module HigA family antidote
MAKKKIVSPADALKAKMDEFLVTIPVLAKGIGMSPSMVRNFLAGRASLSIPTSLKLSKYFNTTVEYWRAIQEAYDLSEAKNDKTLEKELKDIAKVKKPSAKETAAAKEKALSKKTAKKEPAKPGRRGGRAVKDAPVKPARAKSVSPRKAKEVKPAAPRKPAARRARKSAQETPVDQPKPKMQAILIKDGQEQPPTLFPDTSAPSEE